MLDANPLAVTGGRAGVNNGAVHDGQDGGAYGVSDVDAGMERAPARAEAGSEDTFAGRATDGSRFASSAAARASAAWMALSS